jgi:hypothetical protein
MQTEALRDKTFNMRLTGEEWARFEVVASHYGLPVASMLRMLIKEKYEQLAYKVGDDIEQTLSQPAEDAMAPARLREAASKWRRARRDFNAWKAPRKDAPEIHADQAKKETNLLIAFRRYQKNPAQLLILVRAYDVVRNDFYVKAMTQK